MCCQLRGLSWIVPVTRCVYTNVWFWKTNILYLTRLSLSSAGLHVLEGRHLFGAPSPYSYLLSKRANRQFCDMICKRPPESRSYLRWQRSLTPPCSSWGETSTLPAQPQKHFITSGRLRSPKTRTAGSVESYERSAEKRSHRICTPPRLIAPFHTNWRVCVWLWLWWWCGGVCGGGGLTT